MARTLNSHIAAAVRSGPSPVAGIINRLAYAVKDYHRVYAIDIVAGLVKGLDGGTERASHYHTALHAFTDVIAALDPTESNPWAVAVTLSTVTDPGHVTLDPPGQGLLAAIGDANDDAAATQATERALSALVRLARNSARGDLGQRHVSHQMLILALGVLNTDPHKLAAQLLSAEEAH